MQHTALLEVDADRSADGGIGYPSAWREILVLLDGTQRDEAPLGAAASLAGAFHAQVSAVCVPPNGPGAVKMQPRAGSVCLGYAAPRELSS